MVAEDLTLSAAVNAFGETMTGDEVGEVNRDLVRGDSVGRFLVLEKLGQGGMGVVYAAFDPELDRKVAVKLVLPEGDNGAQARARMLREAQAMAQLAHPNVVTVHDVGAIGNRIWIAMEHIGGQTLTRWLAKQRRSWRQIVDVFMQAGEGLRAAHEAGLVHRDFKPDNVMIDEVGRVRVMDFGLARSGAPAASETESKPVSEPLVTQAGALVGTPRYMSPEQWQGHVSDAKADQFAFCVALWEALYKQPPFGGSDVAELISAVLAGDIRKPSNSNVIPWWLRRTLQRGLAVAPSKRWPSMRALSSALDRRPRQRRLAVVGVLLAGLAAASAFALQADADQCALAGEPIAQVWDPARRVEIEARFRATGLVYAQDTWDRVAIDLDAYAQMWTSEATTVCRSSERETQDLVQLCLERRRVEYRSLIEVFATATPEVVESARQAVRRLIPPRSCLDTRLAEIEASLPLPDNPLVIGALRERLSRVMAEESAGRYDTALNDIVELQAEVDATGYLPLNAEVALRRGSILARMNKFTAADEALVVAIAAADGAGHDLVRAEAMVARIEVAGILLAQQDLMQSWIPMTKNLVARVAPDTRLEALMWTHAGRVASEHHSYGEAEALHRRALALLSRISEDDDPARIAVLLNLSYSLQAREYRAEGLTVLAEAEALTRRVLGPEHPSLIPIYNALGNTQLDPASSPAYYEKARALSERIFGCRSLMVAVALANIAELQMFEGDVATARDNYARAVDIIADTYDDSNPKLAGLLIQLAEAQAKSGELVAARETYTRADAIYAQHPLTPDAAYAASGLAMTYELEQQWEKARELYHKANELMAGRTAETPHFFTEGLRGEATALLELGHPAEAVVLARRITDHSGKFNRRGVGLTRFVLARALYALGERNSAFAEAETALVELSTEHLDAGAIMADIEGWLASVRTEADPPRPPQVLR